MDGLLLESKEGIPNLSMTFYITFDGGRGFFVVFIVPTFPGAFLASLGGLSSDVSFFCPPAAGRR